MGARLWFAPLQAGGAARQPDVERYADPTIGGPPNDGQWSSLLEQAPSLRYG